MTSSPKIGRPALLGAVLLATTWGQTPGCASDSKSGPQGGSSGATSAGHGGTAGTIGSAATGGRYATGGAVATGGSIGERPDASAGDDSAEVGPSNDALAAGFITWTYQDTPMGLFMPAPIGKPLPVVMYLHACQNDPLYEGFWIISALNAIEPCAVFLPTAPPGIDYACADWGGTYDSALRPNMINALAELDRLIGQYGFDTKRQYLYGESMGGEGVYRLLVDYPTRFAGAVAAAGYTLDTGAGEMAETPLWIFHGSEDSINPVENDRAIYQSILDAGGTQVRYTEYPGLDHVPAIEQARTEPGLLQWLLSQHRD